MDKEKIMQEISKLLDPMLEEGVTYYSTPINEEFGTSDDMLYRIKDGKKDYDCCKNIDEIYSQFSIEDESITRYNVIKTFPVNTRIKFTFQKGKPMQAELYSTEMIIEDLKYDLQHACSYSGLQKIETEVQFLVFGKKLKLNGYKKRTKIDSTEVSTDNVFDENLTLLFYSLGKKIKKLHYVYENGFLTLSTQPGFPEWNIPEMKEPVINLDLDETDANAIFAFLESLEEQKIAKAVKVLKSNPSLLARAEGRYLNLIRTRLQDPKAGLEQLSNIQVVNNLNVSLMLGKNIGKDFISFAYLDDSETSFIVDYLGSMVCNAFSCNALIEEMKSIKKSAGVKGLTKIYQKYADILRAWLNQESEFYSDGWFGKINSKLFQMSIKKVLFDHTSFEKANKSLVMNEFMFFLNHNSDSIVFMDIFQSDCPQFGSMFWLLPKVPKTLWGDVIPKFPASVLCFERKAEFRDGDGKREYFVSEIKTEN